MNNYIIAGLFLSLFAACVVPINTGFESARMLNKGETEVMGHYTYNSFTEGGESDGVNHNFGLRLGYGLTNGVGLKARYVRLVPVEEGASGVNYIDLAPKFSLWPDRIAATVPFGLYFSDDESEFVISPKFLFTYPASNRFEATIATKADIFPEGEDVYLGLNLGFGFTIGNALADKSMAFTAGLYRNRRRLGSWLIRFSKRRSDLYSISPCPLPLASYPA